MCPKTQSGEVGRTSTLTKTRLCAFLDRIAAGSLASRQTEFRFFRILLTHPQSIGCQCSGSECWGWCLEERGKFRTLVQILHLDAGGPRLQTYGFCSGPSSAKDDGQSVRPSDGRRERKRQLCIMTGPAHILLVDDDRHVVSYLKMALEESGYNVTATTSGKEAMAVIPRSMPDLLLLDLNMPKPDGFDLLKAARSRYPRLKILVISGYLHGDLLEAAKMFGADGTLEKPVAADALARKVREVLGR